ncbi:hypothetical protein ALC60_12080 [Trachymyrmex zeteki]|uniref:Uncharacterized protein n=1 Tax=Mycetomoellerius zeteki TaxID=64791 RepID=A0A151WMG0_9HYME|nr:hypothetical protein ALC60_12080 [Trachymyrmex zeteki]
MPGRSGDVRSTNLSTSFSCEKKRKEETSVLSVGRNDDNYDRSDRTSHYLSCGTYDAVLAKGYNTPLRLVL